MTDANQGAPGRQPDERRDAKRGASDPAAGFDPLAGDDAGITNPVDAGGTPVEPDTGDVAPMGLDELDSMLCEALSLEIEAHTHPDHLPIAADENLSLDAAIGLYADLPAEADLEDPSWCAALLERPTLRGDLADLAGAMDDAATAELAPQVRRAALSAYTRAAAATAAVEAADAAPATTPSSTPLRIAKRDPSPSLASWFGWRAAAAVLLVGLGVTIVAVGGLLHDDVTGNGAGAEAGLKLDHVTEHRLGPTPGFASRQSWVRVGESFAPSVDEVVVFGLGQASQVIVGDGGRLGVAAGKAIDARLMARARADLDAGDAVLDLAAVLRLEAGEAQIGSAGKRPVLLAVGEELLVVLQRGKAHVAIDPGAKEGMSGHAIALAKGTQAVVYRAANGDRAAKTFELAGPKRVLLGAEGPTAFGSPAASLFRDLELFGGSLDAARRGDRSVRIAATLWRSIDRVAKRTNGRFRIADGRRALLAFLPQNTLYGATDLRVWLRAPAGTRVSVRPGKDLDAVLGTADVSTDTRTAEPGVESVLVPLPSDWYAKLAGGEIVVEIMPVDTPAKMHRDAANRDAANRDAANRGKPGFFEGAAFVMGDAASRRSEAESSK